MLADTRAASASARAVGQWGGAGGTICEDHFGLIEAFMGLAGEAAQNRFFAASVLQTGVAP